MSSKIKMSTGESKSNRLSTWKIRVTLGLLVFWALMVFTGLRLPYLYTEFVLFFRPYVLFPLLVAVLSYLLFKHRKPGQRSSLYATRMANIRGLKGRVKETVWGVFGFLFIAGVLSWTSVVFPAWAANFFSVKPYMQVWVVEGVKKRSGAVWSTLFDLDLIEPETGKKAALMLTRSRYEMKRWRQGDHICVIGRTGLFGTITEDIRKECLTN